MSKIITSFKTAGSNPVIINGDGTGKLQLPALDGTADAFTATTKGYVDAFIQGLRSHEAVRAKTAAALSTYTQSGAGVGATLTCITPLTALVVDDIAVVEGDRVLVTHAVLAANNGIYEVTQLGTGSVPWILTRASDADSIVSLGPSSYAFVSEGTLYADTGWTVTTDASAYTVVDTSDLAWAQFSSTAQIDAANSASGTGVGEIYKNKVGPVLTFKKIASTETSNASLLSIANGVDDVTVNIDTTKILSVGAVDAGSITSGFTSIDIGTGALTAGTTVIAGTTDTALDVSGGAFLPPRMSTATRDALTAVVGMVVFNTDHACLNQWDGSAWIRLATDKMRVLTTADATVTLDDSHAMVITSSTSAQTITLPDPTTVAGRQYIIIKSGSGANTSVVSSGGELFDGAGDATLNMVIHDRITAISSGLYWVTL